MVGLRVYGLAGRLVLDEPRGDASSRGSRAGSTKLSGRSSLLCWIPSGIFRSIEIRLRAFEDRIDSNSASRSFLSLDSMGFWSGEFPFVKYEGSTLFALGPYDMMIVRFYLIMRMN